MTPALVDRPRSVRAGEELDAAKLQGWIEANVEDVVGPVDVQQFPSGHSNLTYLLSAHDRPGNKRELVLRRPPFGSKVKTAHDMGREFRILSKLHTVYTPAPRPLGHCDDADVLGAPFYLMERIEGVILRKSIPPSLGASAETLARLSDAFIDNLATMHTLDFAAAGLGDLGKPSGYVARQVQGWTERYRGSQTDDLPDVDALAAWLAARIPAESGAALIHNDYKLDNLVLDPVDPTRIVGVLDWEMSTLGDPLMDLGTALGYWVEATDSDELRAFAFGPTYLPGFATRKELAERYAERTGRDVSQMLFYYCFALFKNLVIAQQIYFRYKQGLTHDERFGMFIVGVRILARSGVEAMASGSYSR